MFMPAQAFTNAMRPELQDVACYGMLFERIDGTSEVAVGLPTCHTMLDLSIQHIFDWKKDM